MQQKTKTETEPEYKSPLSRRKLAAVIAFAVAVGVGPSQAAFAYEGPDPMGSNTSPEKLAAIKAQVLVLEESASTPIVAEAFEEEVAPLPTPTVTQVRSATTASIPPASGSGSYALLAAARAQLGWAQDCTGLVENALRALGYGVGDLAPMGFSGVGYQVSPADAQPGDIMMRGGHVAIYAGNGVAVHGGFNGSTVETSIDGSPYNYAVIIRL